MTESGLKAVLLENRPKLLRFLASHGAGDAADDLLQELWIRISAADHGPVGQPLSYLYRAANNLMLDRYRSQQQAAKRDAEWVGVATSGTDRAEAPEGERPIIARETLRLAEQALDALGERPARIFRRHRIDGAAQKVIARELNVSLSTVEADLRTAYRAMIEFRRRLDEA